MARFQPTDPSNKDLNGAEQQMGIQFGATDAGEITSREAGNMVKRMIAYAEEQLKNGKSRRE